MNSSLEKDRLCLTAPQSVRMVQYEKIRREGLCHRWLGTSAGRAGKGYGRFKYAGRSFMVHRAFLLWDTDAPRPQYIALHTCGNSWCVNAKHLRWGTPKENGQDHARHQRSGKGMPSRLSKIAHRFALAWQAAWHPKET